MATSRLGAFSLMRFHEDHRRAFYGDVFELSNGDINIVRLKPHAVIAWHRHQKQDDHLFCLEGELLVQILHEGGRTRWYLNAPDDHSIVTIPRNTWHGYSSQHGATILQFNGPGKWTEDNPDEERLSLEEVPWT